MENFKRSAKRFLTRLTILGLVVICGAIAIAQVQKQNDAIAADSAGVHRASVENSGGASLQFASGLPNDTASDGAPGAVIGLPARVPMETASNSVEPRRLDSVPAEQLVHDPSPTSEFDATDFPSDDEFAAANDTREFMNDDQIVQAQATSNRFDRGFDEPFPSNAPGPQDDDAGPPQFGGYDEAAPGIDDVPEFLGENDAPPVDDGPTFPAQDDYANEFPAGNFDAAFPAASAADAQPPTFGNAADNVNSSNQLRAGSNNRLRQPDAAPQFGELPEPRTSSGAAATTPVAQQAIPPVRSFGDSDNFGNAAFDDGASFGATDRLDAGMPADNPPTIDREFGNNPNLSSTGLPSPELNGTQSASISVQKTPPTQAHVGEPATFKIRVRNNSTRPVERVIVRDQVPKGTELVETDPPAKQASTGGVYWELDTLRAGEERTVTMQVVPRIEQLIGSVAEVSFTTMASAQVEVRRPMLKIEHTTQPEILLGETVRFAIVIENPGTGTAKNVTLEEDVPQGLSHSKGSRLDYKVGDIPPGGQRRLELSLKAAEIGTVTNVIRARSSNGLEAEHQVNLDIVAPDLKVLIDGPSTRYLERQATYTVELQNRGTAAAENVSLRVQLPPGLKFVSTGSKGRYDSATHSIRWLLRALEPNKGASVELTVDPQQKGEFVLNATATADRNLRDVKDHPLTVEGIAALLFEVRDQVDPIEIGGITTYNIQVTNQGTKEANNVEFLAQVPAGMEAVAPQGSSQYQVQGNLIRFQPIARLAAKEKASYSVQIRGRSAGDQRFKVQMTSSATPTPVIKEESTRVYSDQ